MMNTKPTGHGAGPGPPLNGPNSATFRLGAVPSYAEVLARNCRHSRAMQPAQFSRREKSMRAEPAPGNREARVAVTAAASASTTAAFHSVTGNLKKPTVSAGSVRRPRRTVTFADVVEHEHEYERQASVGMGEREREQKKRAGHETRVALDPRNPPTPATLDTPALTSLISAMKIYVGTRSQALSAQRSHVLDVERGCYRRRLEQIDTEIRQLVVEKEMIESALKELDAMENSVGHWEQMHIREKLWLQLAEIELVRRTFKSEVELAKQRLKYI